jgi:hypothetical protein
MTTLTPIGGGHMALGAAGDASGSNAPGDPAAGTADAVGPRGGAPAPPTNAVYINPQIQVDPQSGVVMLEYRDQAGKLTRQVPSEYELRSYRLDNRPNKT